MSMFCYQCQETAKNTGCTVRGVCGKTEEVAQKAVIVLLALLYLGVKNIHLGPTLPGFLSPNVAKVLTEKFNIAGIGTVEGDIENFMK